MDNIKNRILKLKKERNAVILAHLYQSLDVQDVADIVGDSHELARKATTIDCETLVVCGVRFMAESAKILNPGKKVLLPAPDAGCPMADMITPDDITAMRAAHPNAAVVCYVNSTAATKARADICCTSSNALRVVRSLTEKQIVFVPDKNLGSFIAKKAPEKEFFFFDGGCPIHGRMTVAEFEAAKAAHPNALTAVHPECPPEITNAADFAGSTSQIIDFAQKSDAKEFIIGTEVAIVERLGKDNPEKKFYLLSPSLFCPDMKKTTLEKIESTLEHGENEVALDEELIKSAYRPLYRMINV